MKCPICDDGRHLYVYKTMQEDGVTFRLRRCVRGHEFWTRESILLEKDNNPPLTGDDILTLLQNERGPDGKDVSTDSVQRR